MRLGLMKVLHKHVDPKRLLLELAVGKHKACPFPEESLIEGRKVLEDVLRNHGATGDLGAVPEGQPFRLRSLAEFLRIAGDPDWRIFWDHEQSFAKGVNVGY